MKYDYAWKINTVDGKSYVVNTNEGNIITFTQSLMPMDGRDTISTFDLYNEYITEECKYNAISIIGSHVVSVEYYVER